MARGSKGKQLAVGSSFRNSVLYLSSKGHWYVKKGITISLPALVMLGSQFTAARLYRFWCQTQLLVVERPHPWTNPVRREAARQRGRIACFFNPFWLKESQSQATSPLHSIDYCHELHGYVGSRSSGNDAVVQDC